MKIEIKINKLRNWRFINLVEATKCPKRERMYKYAETTENNCPIIIDDKNLSNFKETVGTEQKENIAALH